ncbi:MAG: TM1812 family CRISPR-associated protein [Exilispira sp.]
MKRFIYQIGRLEAEMKPRKFRINFSEPIESNLSSIALKKYFCQNYKDDRIYTILAFPVSLPFNNRLEKSNSLSDDFKKKIKGLNEKNEEKENYFKDPESFFNFHPHSREVDYFFVIHSIGTFNNVDFNADFNFIVFDIFLDILYRFLYEVIKVDGKNEYKSEDIHLYIDVSSGHNIYVSALIEATNIFEEFYNYLNLFQGKTLNVNLVFSDPVFDESSIYDIHTEYSLKHKLFFKNQFDEKDIKDNVAAKIISFEKNCYREFNKKEIDNFNDEISADNLIKNLINKDKRELKNIISNILNYYSIVYSSLKNATPLPLYQFEQNFFYKKKEYIINEQLIMGTINDIIKIAGFLLRKNWNFVNISTDNFTDNNMEISYFDYLKKVLFSFAFLSSYLKEARKLDIRFKDMVSYDEILNNFVENEKSILNKMGNITGMKLVGNELFTYKQKNKEGTSVEENVNSNWVTLSRCLPFYDKTKDNEFNINPRHFLAHSGFERNITEIKKEDNQLYFRYKVENSSVFENLSEKMSEKISENLPENIFENISDNINNVNKPKNRIKNIIADILLKNL